MKQATLLGLIFLTSPLVAMKTTRKGAQLDVHQEANATGLNMTQVLREMVRADIEDAAQVTNPKVEGAGAETAQGMERLAANLEFLKLKVAQLDACQQSYFLSRLVLRPKLPCLLHCPRKRSSRSNKFSFKRRSLCFDKSRAAVGMQAATSRGICRYWRHGESMETLGRQG